MRTNNMNYNLIFSTKIVNDMKKNGMHCRILRSHTGGTTPRYDIEFDDGSQIHGVYEEELR